MLAEFPPRHASASRQRRWVARGGLWLWDRATRGRRSDTALKTAAIAFDLARTIARGEPLASDQGEVTARGDCAAGGVAEILTGWCAQKRSPAREDGSTSATGRLQPPTPPPPGGPFTGQGCSHEAGTATGPPGIEIARPPGAGSLALQLGLERINRRFTPALAQAGRDNRRCHRGVRGLCTDGLQGRCRLAGRGNQSIAVVSIADRAPGTLARDQLAGAADMNAQFKRARRPALVRSRPRRRPIGPPASGSPQDLLATGGPARAPRRHA